MRSPALDRAARRIVWLRLGGLAVAVVLAGRAAHLTVAHARARSLYEQQIQTEQKLSPARGLIVDRNERELALTTEAASIYALPRLIEDREATAGALADALGRDREHVAERLAANENFTYVARWVDPAIADRIREADLAGVGIDREPRRSYPAGKLAAPLLGFANIDGHGVRGIEQIEDRWLTGQPRRVRVERDARGRPLALRSTDPRETQGGDIALTLDAAMQGAAEAALHDAVDRHDALGGLILTLDPRTGDLLALAEAPGFDPNHFRTLDFPDTRARAFTDVVEAGSTMKVFLIASALEAGLIDPQSEFDTGEGWMRVPGKTIRDSKPHGIIGAADVLRVSSNVGSVQIAQLLGREAQHSALLRFGFGKSTNSRYPMESAGLVRDWLRWRPVDQATVAFGQGISVTGIQLASAVAALANEGERMRPRLVLGRRRAGAQWERTEPESLGRATSVRAARQTLDMMQSVVSSEGTGRLAGLKGVPVAGKTGTAQKLDVEAGRYSNDRYIAWFVGVVPADDPELAIVVAIDEPQGRLHGGGSVAAPVFARVAAAQLARRGIVTEPSPFPLPPPTPVLLVENAEEPARVTPRNEPSVSVPVPIVAPEPKPIQRIEAPQHAAVAAPPPRPAAVITAAGPSPTLDAAFVPDFSGKTMDRALAIARSEALVLTIRGAIEGQVVSQLPVPGTVLEGEDRTVRLRFSAVREEG